MAMKIEFDDRSFQKVAYFVKQNNDSSWVTKKTLEDIENKMRQFCYDLIQRDKNRRSRFLSGGSGGYYVMGYIRDFDTYYFTAMVHDCILPMPPNEPIIKYDTVGSGGGNSSEVFILKHK
jgi:hypothetical protein